jgi:hypothetical protein
MIGRLARERTVYWNVRPYESQPDCDRRRRPAPGLSKTLVLDFGFESLGELVPMNLSRSHPISDALRSPKIRWMIDFPLEPRSQGAQVLEAGWENGI